MITLHDIEDMSCLSRSEISAIAEHEGIPELNASCLGEYLMHLPKGPQHVQQMICEDIRSALHADNVSHARDLFSVLKHFIAEHPEAVRGAEA